MDNNLCGMKAERIRRNLLNKTFITNERNEKYMSAVIYHLHSYYHNQSTTYWEDKQLEATAREMSQQEKKNKRKEKNSYGNNNNNSNNNNKNDHCNKFHSKITPLNQYQSRPQTSVTANQASNFSATEKIEKRKDTYNTWRENVNDFITRTYISIIQGRINQH